MTRTHLRKIIGDILARKGRTVLVTASIFVGVLGVITLFSVRNLITHRLEEDLDESRIAMIEVSVGIPEGITVDNDADLALLNDPTLQGLSGIEIVEGRALHNIGYKKPGDDAFQTAQLRAYSSPLQDIYIEPLRLVEGNYPVVGERQVALETRMADANDFEVGDSIVFQISEDGQTTEITYTVSGIVFHAYSYRAPSTLGGFSPGPDVGIYAQYEDAQALLGFAGFNRIAARYDSYAQADAQLEAFQQAIVDNTGYETNIVESEDPAQNQQITTAENFNSVLTMLSFVAMLVSGFLVINVINTIVVEQKRQIGSMKSIGATGRDVLIIYTGIALAYGMMGTLLAIGPSIYLGSVAARNLAPQLDVLLEGFDWSPEAIVIGIVLGILIPALSALIPVLAGMRVSIFDAITDRGISLDYGIGPVAFLIKKLPLSMTLRQAFNNLNRRKSRLALTGITLTSAVAAFMGVTAVGISLTNVINDVFERLQYEILIVPNELLAVEKIQETIESVDGVALASPGTVVPVELGEDYLNFFTASNQIVVYGLDPQSGIFKFDLADGDGWNNNPGRDGVVISTGLSDQLGLEAGDKLTFSVRGEPIELPIIGVDSLAFDSMWVRWQELSEKIGLVSPQIGGIGGQPLSNGYYILLQNSDPTVAQVNDTIEQISGALLEQNITIQEVRNQVEQSEETTRFINQNIGILNLAAALIALVGGIGLLATLSMAVFERQKEIGVMRAIGGTSQVIAFQFLIEGLAVGLISWIIAIPISYGLALVINQTLNLETIKFVYPLDVLALGLGGMMIIASVASIGPSIGAARKTVSSILRYQ